ncbi:2-isopropylmalate synthase [Kitasatospora sp. MAP12-15]|uniref:2-isopropylmalate synthase n=1 Tax=unclassified Kitasatospora TaxID=2633591 RepID=UPI0024739577|nr:2-isopropylmalate synthase [Kitasatospora sp. MAP12-44]MDH6113686.1 2-isopropylmalate synthase [Kitasatospora sp. MAP12-44]
MASRGTRRYQPFAPLSLPDRSWPDRSVSTAPRWLSTDLRDGNQALVNPMTPARKLAMFDLLVEMGYQEIEVGFPVASQDDYDFVRMLIEQDRIPEDVRISVLVPAREELIERTARCLVGAHSATLHVYNATAPLFRDLVLRVSRDECKELAVRGTRWMMKYAEKYLGGCDLGYQYSPELFNETEPEFAVEVCEAVMDTWETGPDRPIVLNFPSTVERSLPHVFADQIEWLDRNLSRRDYRCLSIHPHNDRGTGVASAELAMLAGAQRIEGCLFGSGERAGNVCLVTLGLNLYTQGVDPGIDFSDIDRIRRTVEFCNEMPVSPRHPYGGSLVYTAFSGSHQDAIKKGFDALAVQAADARQPIGELPWQMPYLPIDPQDVGRDYEAVVRINSQSGKGGVAYIMSAWHGLRLPVELQVEFARVVQAVTDRTGDELAPDRIRAIFEEEYRVAADSSRPLGVRHEPVLAELFIEGELDLADEAVRELGTTLAPWGVEVRSVHGTGAAGEFKRETAAVYARCTFEDQSFWGFGLHRDVQAAAFSAVRAAAARAGQSAPAEEAVRAA